MVSLRYLLNFFYLPHIIIVTNSFTYIYISYNFIVKSIFIFKNFKCIEQLNKVYSYTLSKEQYSTVTLLTYINSLVLMNWCKLVFKGKSFRIRPTKNYSKITFKLGYSHWTKVHYNKEQITLIKLNRQKFILSALSSIKLQNFISLILGIRPLNKYTVRGLRLRQQPIARRFGKLSQYVSALH